MENYPTTMREAKEYKYNFWSDKPVTPLKEYLSGKDGSINDNFGKDKLYEQSEPLDMKPFEWKKIQLSDMNDDDDFFSKTVEFINKWNYIDIREKFRFHYTSDYVKWSLGNEGVLMVLHYNGEPVATLGIETLKMTVFTHSDTFKVIKFLCIHPKYRGNDDSRGKGKRTLVHAVLDEATRDLYNQNSKHGMFITGKFVPTPVTSIRNYNRPLNYNKLYKLGFTIIKGSNESLHESFKVKGSPLKYYLPASQDDVDRMYEVYTDYRQMFNISVDYTLTQFKDLLFAPGVRTIALNSTKTGKLEDFVSYYVGDISVEKSDDKIRYAKLLMYTCSREDTNVMISNLLKYIETKEKEGVDVLFCDDTNQNHNFVLSSPKFPDEESDEEDYKKAYDHMFMRDSRKYFMNLFNFRCERVKPFQVLYPVH